MSSSGKEKSREELKVKDDFRDGTPGPVKPPPPPPPPKKKPKSKR